MDYTSVDLIKGELRIGKATDDDLLTRLATAASRAFDRYCTGAKTGSDNYFELATVTDELITGVVNQDGSIVCWPRKADVSDVSSFSYRTSPRESWLAAELDYVEFDKGVVTAWESLSSRQAQRVKITYTGGLADDINNLPADLVEVVTVLAARFYREAEAGLADMIGVADVGMLIYSKALPLRVVKMAEPYRRVVRW
ncbi:MAG: hypothetical protein KDJ52_00190 [Anaerolineae bacterium]|nr:hypothetical protein [Anaerolineae bacterium]